mgnify:CR=1 FL=1
MAVSFGVGGFERSERSRDFLFRAYAANVVSCNLTKGDVDP